MKTIPFYIFALVLALTSCEKNSVDTIKGYYDYLHFERAGAGQTYFDLYATVDPNKLKAIVSKYNFRDTTFQAIIDKNSDNTDLFYDFNKALSNKVELSGNFTQPTAPSGTWAFLYFVTNSKQTEVTNTDLRNSLLKIEQNIRDKVK